MEKICEPKFKIKKIIKIKLKKAKNLSVLYRKDEIKTLKRNASLGRQIIYL